MTRLYFALDLHDDEAAIRQYEQWHQPDRIWPEIVAAIREADIREMEIFRTGPRLVMAMEVGHAFDPQAKAVADAANPRVRAWEALMEDFQQALPWAQPGEKWVPMTRIFSLQQCAD
jgi:L-rhamnose mutarotase